MEKQIPSMGYLLNRYFGRGGVIVGFWMINEYKIIQTDKCGSDYCYLDSMVIMDTDVTLPCVLQHKALRWNSVQLFVAL
jgi:hypothetical protein